MASKSCIAQNPQPRVVAVLVSEFIGALLAPLFLLPFYDAVETARKQFALYMPRKACTNIYPVLDRSRTCCFPQST